MTFGFGLGSGLRALTAARLGMQTAGNNVANANTAGYSRQRVDLASALPFGISGNYQIGTGVDVRGITRLVDEGLERRLQLQMGLVGAAEVDQSRYAELESILGEPDGGLSNQLQGLFGAVDKLRTDPADRSLRGGVVQAGSALSQGFRLISQRFSQLGGSTFDEVRGLVRVVNQAAKSIADLNGQIISAEATGADANDLRDTRAQQIKELGKVLDVRGIERASGSVDLLVGGHLLVAGNRPSSIAVAKDASGTTKVTVGKSTTPVNVREGRIAALLQQESDAVPGLTSRVDELARNTILEWNRLHTTGMPASGPFRTLTGAYGVVDGDGDGERGDELLSQSGFQFDVQQGDLYVSVTNAGTGAMERTRVRIDPRSMSLRDVASALNAVDHLTASVDPTGRLRIDADVGYGFDFSPRLDPNPDGAGTFGGTQPSIGSSSAGPYDLSGQTFPVSFTVQTGSATAPTTTTVTLAANDFANPAAATADELVAAINADLGSAGTARSVGGRLVVQSAQGTATSQLTLANVGAGTALSALGLSTATAAGRNTAVAVSVEGTYTGAGNEQYVFVPESDGNVGQTQDLRVRVLDHAGNLVTTVNLGRGYEPGSLVDIGSGIKVSFGPGSLSATNGNVFELDALADSDTSDVLVATGMNVFFLGSSAADIAVNPDLLANPDRLAAAIGTADGDAGNLVRLTALRSRDLGSLDTNTIEDFYTDIVGDIGFEASAANAALGAQQQLLAQLQADRDSISGVNIDEEMVDMLSFQQSYDAAARFISVAQQMTDTLINLGR
ncbi:MAG TPA: flagellar hook-associated protein FlgK [Planctomycetota bacterium]|nr:flagellar hook-associated protein FlgK [Planctomycetota bacterium]